MMIRSLCLNVILASSLGLGGCAATGSIQGVDAKVSAVAASPLAICSQVVSQAATSLGQLKQQLNGVAATAP
jgi:hypothetical protein